VYNICPQLCCKLLKILTDKSKDFLTYKSTKIRKEKKKKVVSTTGKKYAKPWP